MRIKLLNEGVVDSASRSVEGKPSYGWGAAGLGMIPDAIDPVERLIAGGEVNKKGQISTYDMIAGKPFKNEAGDTVSISPTRSDPYLKQKDLATVALTAGGAIEGVADLLGKSENPISKWVAHPALIGGIGVKDAFQTTNQLRQAKELWNAGKTTEAKRKALETIEPATMSAASLAALGSHYLPSIIPATPATTGTFARSLGGAVTGLTNKLDKLATEYENEGMEGVEKALDTMDRHDATNAAWGTFGPVMDWALRKQMEKQIPARLAGKMASKALPFGVGMIPSALFAGKQLGHGIMDASSGNWELALKRGALGVGELVSGLGYATGGGAAAGAAADVGIALKQQQLEKEEEEMDAEEYRKQAEKDTEARLKRAAEQRKERLQPVFEQFRAREREREREKDKGGERLSDASRDVFELMNAPKQKEAKKPKEKEAEKPKEKETEKKPGFFNRILKGLGIATTGAVAGVVAGANDDADKTDKITPLKYFDPTREEIAGNETLVASAKTPQFDWYRNQWYTMPTRIMSSTIINEGKLTPKESLQRKLKKQRYKVSYVQDGKKVEVFASSIRGVRRVVYGKKQYKVHNSTGSDVTGYFKKLLGE